MSQTYRCLTPLQHDGRSYAPTETLVLSDRQAAPLLAVGTVAPDAERTPEPPPPPRRRRKAKEPRPRAVEPRPRAVEPRPGAS